MKTARAIVWTKLVEPGLDRLGHAGIGFDAAEGVSGADRLVIQGVARLNHVATSEEWRIMSHGT